MKIAYLIEGDFSKNSGVIQKIKCQINEWKSLGHNAFPIFISPYTKRTYFEGQIYSSALARAIPIKFVKTYLNKVLVINQVNKYLKKISPDIVYTRQTTWCLGLDKLLKSYNTVMELNSIDRNEIKQWNWLRRKIYTYGRERLLNSVKGFVSVSNEIKLIYLEYKKPITTISNGIDFSGIEKFVSTKKKITRNPQVIFIGSPNQTWLGIDKYIYMADKIPEADFHLIGPEITNLDLPKNLTSHGYLSTNKLREIYKIADLGVGTLALHRKNMKEASPLKTREYLAYGLPCIIGYFDTDLGAYNNFKFILNIGNYENNVFDNIENIRLFIHKMKRYEVKISKTDIAISSEEKEEERINFFKEKVIQ